MTLKILQISDCHLLESLQQSHYGAVPEEQLEKLSSIVEQADYVIFTGDLVHDASISAYQWLARWCEGFDVPIMFIAGNHDSPKIMEQELPGCEATDIQVYNVKDWQFIGLNSHKDNTTSGFVSEAQLAALDNMLRKGSGKSLVFLHHQPVNVRSSGIDKQGLLQQKNIQKVFEVHKERIGGVFFGHIHHEWEMQFKGVNYYGCPSTLYQTKGDCDDYIITGNLPSCRMIELDGNKTLASYCVYHEVT